MRAVNPAVSSHLPSALEHASRALLSQKTKSAPSETGSSQLSSTLATIPVGSCHKLEGYPSTRL